MCHSAAGSPGGFSQPFFRLNCKGFTRLHTQSERSIPSKHKAAVGLLGPQRCFRHSHNAWRGRGRLKYLPLNSPIMVISNQTVRKPVGRQGCGGSYSTHWAQDFKPQQRHLGSWAYIRGLKESPVGSFRICLRPFQPPESTKFCLARLATLCIRYPRLGKWATRIDLVRGIEKPSPLVSCPSEEIFSFALDFA